VEVYVISKTTLVYLREFEKTGALKSYMYFLRFQLETEQYLFGEPQIPTQEELKCAVAILDGTFNESKEVI
jgi:hypothetical protein